MLRHVENYGTEGHSYFGNFVSICWRVVQPLLIMTMDYQIAATELSMGSQCTPRLVLPLHHVPSVLPILKFAGKLNLEVGGSTTRRELEPITRTRTPLTRSQGLDDPDCLPVHQCRRISKTEMMRLTKFGSYCSPA